MFMIINLSGNVDCCEYVKVTARGTNVETIDSVEFSFSKEALVGFAKNLIWMYEDIDINKKFYVCTDPLGGVPSGNQVVGFYLTTGSPILTLRVNSLDYQHGIKNSNTNQSSGAKCIEILPPASDDLIEEYELGFRNLAGISIHNKNHMDISTDIYEVFLEINYGGLKNLAILLLKLADRYEEGAEYFFQQASEITLTPDSLPVKLKLNNLGNVYDYEPRFGTLGLQT